MSNESEGFVPGKWLKMRMMLAAGLLSVLLVLIAYRAWVLQVREADKLRAMAEGQYLQDVELPARRGRILDRNGVELAASAEVDSVHVNARQIGEKNAADVAHKLAEALHLDRRDIEKKLRARRYFSWIKRRIAADEARAVRELGLPGVFIDREPRRYYPNRGLGGPLIGWAGLDSIGQEGIELAYDRHLRGARAQVPGLRDALGRAVLTGGLESAGEVAGSDLYTTIDRYIQFRLEKALEKGVSQHRAKAGVAVALDPKTGEVLAMASVPSVNPNEPDGAQQRGVRNRAVTDPFEPGSTMKTFPITGALEAGVIKVDENWYCENGKYTVGPATIHDHEGIKDATTTEILAKSSNICTAKIAARLGREKMREVLGRFGFGARTGVDLPGERVGQLRSADRMGPVETATISFGQGMTATPLQVAAGYAAIANDGVWHRPHVMRKITDTNGALLAENAVEARRIISSELAAKMRTMLHAVTQKGGTAEKLSVPGYTFAGKTGTAQKVDPVTRHYSTDKWASSFVGFAPADDPRLVLFVMVDEPQGSHYGSMVAGPVFQETMIDALRWLGVPPNAPLPVVAQKPSAAVPAPPAANVAVPDESDEDGEDAGFVAATDDPRDKGARPSDVPDFSGMSVAEALGAARLAGVRLEIQGSGIATAQTPGPGEARRGAACRVVFTPPG